MNLRILKKLSQRAVPYLPRLGDHREQFLAAEGENYHGLLIRSRKHWERSASVRGDHVRDNGFVIQPRCRAGTRFPFIHVYPSSHPWPGTIMVGETSGYYEPEWEEETAWGALSNMVRDHFCDWDEDGPTPTRRFRNAGDIFRAADEMIAVRQQPRKPFEPFDDWLSSGAQVPF